MAAKAGLWWLLTILSIVLVQAQNEPKVRRKDFEFPVDFVQYFEDSDTVLLRTFDPDAKIPRSLWRSGDAGQTWKELDKIKVPAHVILHPFNNKIAFALSQERQYWVTHDQGNHWEAHSLPADVVPLPAKIGREVLSFHAKDDKKIIFNAVRCDGSRCKEESYYSKDGFEKPEHLKRLREDTRGCAWAHSTKEFQEPEDRHARRRILCLAKGKFSSFAFDQRLLVSDDYFKHEQEPNMSNGRTMQGIIDVAHVKGYKVIAARAKNTRELAMFVSVDGLTWHRAEFEADHKLEERSYTVLESTKYSLQVAVANSPKSSVLMTSNSNGTYFSESLAGIRRDRYSSYVDFEKLMGFQGVILANVLDKDNGIVTKISFNDGKNNSWKSLEADGKEFHLHSVTDRHNPGRVYSRAAPGVLMGIGNAGEKLSDYEKGDLYVSNDAGHKWERRLEGPHKYAFGDQGNVLLAVPEGKTKNAKYSLDHGKSWKEFAFEKDEDIEIEAAITSLDSTSRVFIIIGVSGSGEDARQVTYSIDTDALLSRKCGEADFEEFTALEDHCIMGHKQSYRRRKWDADCFVRSKFEEAKPQNEPCTCTRDDFECAFDYVPQGDGCVPVYMKAPKGECQGDSTSFKSKQGLQLIPGDDCKGGPRYDEEISRPCNDTIPDVASGDVEVSTTKFDGSTNVFDLVYLERTKTSRGDDETVVLLVGTEERKKVYVSHDHGKNWEQKFKGERILRVVRHEYDNDAVFFVTNSEKVFFSYNRCKSTSSFKVRHPYNPQIGSNPLSFHPDNPEMFIWTGATSADCSAKSKSCYLVSEYTKDRGSDWNVLARYTEKCEFVKREGRPAKDNATRLVYCSSHRDEIWNGELELAKSDNFFESKEVVFDDIFAFEIVSEFVVSASMDTDGLLFVNASIAGDDFAPAHFPPHFSTSHKSFTVLQSETHAVFLHALVSGEKGFEYGRILKSDSRGTFYTTSLKDVNSMGGDYGYVDFEKVRGIEGISLANIVSNVGSQGERKKLQTRITHNDGADWGPLQPPQYDQDSDQETYDQDCRSDGECSLHLHGFTARLTPFKDQPYSSSSGVAILLGNGNIGGFLDETGKKDALFMSNDAGMSWKWVRKGRHLWAYGDQGSIIVTVQDTRGDEKTAVLYFSEDEGRTWNKHTFSKEPVSILGITTLPSDSSKSFLIQGAGGDGITIYNIDFSRLRDQDCKLNEDNPSDEKSDYYVWNPNHPFQKDRNCLFGHVAAYHRKKIDSKCWNGPLIDSHGLHDTSQKCECIRQDFECDFNYERRPDGACELIQNLEPPDHSQECKVNVSLISYYPPTGYRRIPLDDCQGGRELERWHAEACPGHEPEFQKTRAGLRGFWFFIVVVLLPLSLAAGIGYHVYNRWDGKFGAIRLGESSADGILDLDKPWIRYPVVAISAIVAIAMAAPRILVSGWKAARSAVGGHRARYTTRASFSRHRGEYTVVEDEDELLGEDDEEEA